MKKKLIGTWYVNFAEMLLAQMGRTVSIMQEQAGMEMPAHLLNLYKERPYLQFAYFLGVYTGVLHADSDESAFEEELENLIDALPGVDIHLQQDNTFIAEMAHANYTGAWQLFGDSHFVITVEKEVPKSDANAYVIPDNWQLEDNQIKGDLLEGFSASLPLRLSQAHKAQLPLTWRLEIQEDMEYKIILSTFPDEQGNTTRIDAYKGEQDAA